MVKQPNVAIIGGGAAGIFAALEIKRLMPGAEVVVLERSHAVLSKVRLSGGGRCNLTHRGEVYELVSCYPRGGAFLRPLFAHFQPRQTIEWFESRGVPLKEESDGRVFPLSNTSQTIVSCLLREMDRQGVQLETDVSISELCPAQGGVVVRETNQKERFFDALLVATGSAPEPLKWAGQLGLAIVPQVPALFGFNSPDPFVAPLSGTSAFVAAELLGKSVCSSLLLTHYGFSGPAILTLSSFLARTLCECHYEGELAIDWMPSLSFQNLYEKIGEFRTTLASCVIKHCPFEGLTEALWRALVQRAHVNESLRWSALSKSAREQVVQCLKKSRFPIRGMAKNKQEFVTAGGVSLLEVNPKTLESKKVSHLFFAGEVLDIDGLTGGYNLQAAWTTGYIAAQGIMHALED